jgi:hypothetical protein
MFVEKLAENFHSHASAYGLVKDHVPPRPSPPEPRIIRSWFGVAIGKIGLLKNFFPMASGAFYRPDPERLRVLRRLRV